MKSVTKWLTDPDADDYPFPHKICERLKSPAKNLEGIVRNAKYSGTEKATPPGSYITSKLIAALWLCIDSANIQYS